MLSYFSYLQPNLISISKSYILSISVIDLKFQNLEAIVFCIIRTWLFRIVNIKITTILKTNALHYS